VLPPTRERSAVRVGATEGDGRGSEEGPSRHGNCHLNQPPGVGVDAEKGRRQKELGRAQHLDLPRRSLGGPNRHGKVRRDLTGEKRVNHGAVTQRYRLGNDGGGIGNRCRGGANCTVARFPPMLEFAERGSRPVGERAALLGGGDQVPICREKVKQPMRQERDAHKDESRMSVGNAGLSALGAPCVTKGGQKREKLTQKKSNLPRLFQWGSTTIQLLGGIVRQKGEGRGDALGRHRRPRNTSMGSGRKIRWKADRRIQREPTNRTKKGK